MFQFLMIFIGFAFPVFSGESPCYLNLERNFFNEDIVNQALGSHNISQSNWRLINQSLRANSRGIPRIVRERAKKMNPNPFDTPFRPVIAAKILNQVQYEVFEATLTAFKINRKSDIEEMFMYIKNSHADELIKCFGKEAIE